jgi:hypothetical protein
MAEKMNPRKRSAILDDRMPVWEVLAEFFLDTELDDGDYRRISNVLASSPYSIRDIEDILKWEVYPGLIGNLRSITGERVGFNRDWLKRQIGPRLDKRPKIRLPIMDWGLVQESWLRVSTMVLDHRIKSGRPDGASPDPHTSGSQD